MLVNGGFDGCTACALLMVINDNWMIGEWLGVIVSRLKRFSRFSISSTAWRNFAQPIEWPNWEKWPNWEIPNLATIIAQKLTSGSQKWKSLYHA